MKESRFPKGWDAERVGRLIGHYEGLSEEELDAELEAAEEEPTATPAASPLEFVISEATWNSFHWRLRMSDGRIIASSGEVYPTREECLRAIDLVRHSGTASLVSS